MRPCRVVPVATLALQGGNRLRPSGCPCRVLEALGPLCALSLRCPRLRVRGRHAPHLPRPPPLSERWCPRLPLAPLSSARCPSRWLTRSPGRAARPLPCVLPAPRSHRPAGGSRRRPVAPGGPARAGCPLHWDLLAGDPSSPRFSGEGRAQK